MQRFYDVYGMRLVAALLGGAITEPAMVAAWVALAVVAART